MLSTFLDKILSIGFGAVRDVGLRDGLEHRLAVLGLERHLVQPLSVQHQYGDRDVAPFQSGYNCAHLIAVRGPHNRGLDVVLAVIVLGQLSIEVLLAVDCCSPVRLPQLIHLTFDLWLFAHHFRPLLRVLIVLVHRAIARIVFGGFWPSIVTLLSHLSLPSAA